MARNLIASKLINSVRNRAFIPDDTSTYTDSDVLDILNEEMDVGLLNTLLVLNEEHLVTNTEVPFVSGQDSYKIPYRAIGNKLRDVAYIGSSGVYELSQISLEELSDYRRGYTNRYQDVFYIEGDEVKFVNVVLQAEKIRMYFYLRPNVIVKEDECAKINSIDRNTGIILVSNFPTAHSSTTEFDFIQTRTPNKILGFDITPSATNKNQFSYTFDPEDIPDSLQAGDYICIAEESPFPNVPTELHPILAQRAAVFILEAMGDTENLQNARGKLAQMENSVQTMLESRVEGAPQKINPRHSTLVQTKTSGWFRRNRRS